MFGTVRPHTCGLDHRQKTSYQAFYCGLCQSLGEHYGQPQRGLHSYDAVFLGLLADALLDEPAAPSSCRCPVVPVIHRPTIAPDSPAMRFAAGAQMLLADQFLADRAADGKRAYQIARRFLSGTVRSARSLLGELQVDLDPLQRFDQIQLAAERPGVTSPEEAAAPTAHALGLVFEQIANLPGASFRLRSGGTRRTLAALGQAVGRVIYLTDALGDLRKDFLRGEFNPCLESDEGRLAPSDRRIHEATALLRGSLAQIQETLEALPLLRHHELLSNILTGKLRSEALAAIRKAHTWLVPAARAHLLFWKDAGLWARGGQVALWLMAFLWTSLDRLPQALAQNLKDKLKDKAKDKFNKLLDGGAPAPVDAGAAIPDAGAAVPGAGKFSGLDGGLAAPPRPTPRLDAGALLDAGAGQSSAADAGSSGTSGGGAGSDCCCCDACGAGVSAFCGKIFDAFFKDCLGGCFDSMCKGLCDGCCGGMNCNGCHGPNCNGCCHGCK